jgi:hypothetical protein
LTWIVIDKPLNVIGLGVVTGFGAAAPVIGTANVEMPGVTLAHPLDWVVSANALGAVATPTPKASNAPTMVTDNPPALKRLSVNFKVSSPCLFGSDDLVARTKPSARV